MVRLVSAVIECWYDALTGRRKFWVEDKGSS